VNGTGRRFEAKPARPGAGAESTQNSILPSPATGFSFLVGRPHRMSEAFRKLCLDVAHDTKFLHELKDCYHHYQRVLDYIVAHPEERDEMAAGLAGCFYGKPGCVAADVYLLQFLMKSLKWPEIKAAAEERWNDGGNHFWDCEIKRLLDIYHVA
jgi:hypothetical protein